MTISMSLLDAFDAVSWSDQLHRRLEAAGAELSKKQGLRDEKAWLETARQRVAHAREGIGDLLTRVLRLPELEPVREDQARVLQHAAVEAVEKLHAGITFAAGSRAPLLEALYGKLKLPVLRRCDREDFERFTLDFEKRLSTSYARRMFADPSYAIVLPTLEAMRAAFATWRGVFSDVPLAEHEAQALRDELDAAARKVDLPCRQARLLAEAALAPLKDLLDHSSLDQRPRRRTKALSELDQDDMLDRPVVDPAAPSETEAEELAVQQAAELAAKAEHHAPPSEPVEDSPAQTSEPGATQASEPEEDSAGATPEPSPEASPREEAALEVTDEQRPRRARKPKPAEA